MVNSNPVLRRLLETKQFRAKDRTLPLKFCISPEKGEQLYETVRKHGFTRCLEIGCLFGFSSLYLAQACAENGGRLDIVDRPQQVVNWDGEQVDLGNAAERHIEEAGYNDRVTFYRESSLSALPKLRRLGKRYDFAFVDGEHRFSGVLLDIINVDRVLDIGGAIALDDIGPEMALKEWTDGAVNRALAHLFATSRYRIDSEGPSLCVCSKLSEPR
jgi:predicted O-methyltransferase YrrM